RLAETGFVGPCCRSPEPLSCHTLHDRRRAVELAVRIREIANSQSAHHDLIEERATGSRRPDDECHPWFGRVHTRSVSPFDGVEQPVEWTGGSQQRTGGRHKLPFPADGNEFISHRIATTRLRQNVRTGCVAPPTRWR